MKRADTNWLSESDPTGMARRTERVLSAVQDRSGKACPNCQTPVCGHVVVFSIALGFEEEPFCLSCLASETGKELNCLRDELMVYVLTRDCLVQGFRLASIKEESGSGKVPLCLWPGETPVGGRDLNPAGDDGLEPDIGINPDLSRADHFWDAGDLGCGDLVLQLRIRFTDMEAGESMGLVAQDAGAAEDIPAWCRLTGHPLIAATAPHFLIRKKD